MTAFFFPHPALFPGLLGKTRHFNSPGYPIIWRLDSLKVSLTQGWPALGCFPMRRSNVRARKVVNSKLSYEKFKNVNVLANGLSLWRSRPYGDGLNYAAVLTVPALPHKHCFATALAANWCSNGPSGQIVPASHFAHCSRNYFSFVIKKWPDFFHFSCSGGVGGRGEWGISLPPPANNPSP